MGASAGGVEALRALVATLPPNLPATVLVVLHLPRGAFSALPMILQRSGPLPATTAVHGAPLRHGHIYVAPADHHLLVTPSAIELSRGPSENGMRPAVDPLFRSAARAYGARVIGVLLSGTRDDGAAGLAAIAEANGLALVQDPEDALYPGMPTNGLALVPSAIRATAPHLGELIAQHADDGLPTAPPPTEVENADLAEVILMSQPDVPEAPPVFGCPTCHGALYEIHEGGAIRYRCRVGHVWSPHSLLDEQDDALEGALWMALRGLEDKSALARRMAEASLARGNRLTATRYLEKAAEADAAAKLLADLIRRGLSTADDTEIAPEREAEVAE
jgi:two-component system chemotaxis response regulator CheB